MAEIKIIFSTTNKIGSRFLRWAQRCKYSHCEILFDDCIIGARSDGVKKYPIDSVAKAHEVATIECSDAEYVRFKNFMESKVGDGYDWRAYLGFLFYKKNHDDHRWFCSELIQEGFNQAGLVVIKDVNSWFCMPRDFYISPLVIKNGDKIK